jgi:Fe2+ or Zn2+ uptake regulation protein
MSLTLDLFDTALAPISEQNDQQGLNPNQQELLALLQEGDQSVFHVRDNFNQKTGQDLSCATVWQELHDLETKGLIVSDLSGRERIYKLA